jgi:hypothetical protein
VHKILFDHPHAFEEIYCVTFQLLDRTWDEMHAGYMDFPKVIGAVKERISTILPTSHTIPALRRTAFNSNTDPRMRASTMFQPSDEIARVIEVESTAERRTRTIDNKTINDQQLQALRLSVCQQQASKQTN